MNGIYPQGSCSLLRAVTFVLSLAAWIVPATAQQEDNYILGEERRLEMVVHVLGEVQRPGEYRVADDTDVLELISKAGGGSQFANLSGIMITRLNPQPASYEIAQGGTNGDLHPSERLIRVNVDEILKGKSTTPVPILQPGDVVSVPRNGWFKWRTAAAVLRDLSVVFTAYLLAVRTFED